MSTLNGGVFDFDNLEDNEVLVSEIAGSLGKLCRFTGHCKVFYSVAQHSVLCSLMAKKHKMSKDLQYEALMHDAAEAYHGDPSRPFWASVGPEAARIKRAIEAAVRPKLGLSMEPDPIIKVIDNRMLTTEKQQLMVDCGLPWETDGFSPFDIIIKPWGWRRSTAEFIKAYAKLRRKP